MLLGQRQMLWNLTILFVKIEAFRPSQQQKSWRDDTFIYRTLGCHDTQNVLHRYTNAVYMYGWFD